MGFVIDDPTRPQDVREAAKKFFNEGSNIREIKIHVYAKRQTSDSS